jgi:hypothetical protein
VSVADNIKEAFSGTRGKVLVGIGVVVIGYLYWTRGRNGAGETYEEELVPDTSPAGRTPQTDPEVGNDTQGDTTRRPTTNAEWQSAGVDILVGRGTPGTTAFKAISNALNGLPISQQESALVSQVISVLGSPPEGMPPLNITAPDNGGQANPPAYKGPARRNAKPDGQSGWDRGNVGWKKVMHSNWTAEYRGNYSNRAPAGSVTETTHVAALAVRNATHPLKYGKLIYLPATLAP